MCESAVRDTRCTSALTGPRSGAAACRGKEARRVRAPGAAVSPAFPPGCVRLSSRPPHPRSRRARAAHLHARGRLADDEQVLLGEVGRRVDHLVGPLACSKHKSARGGGATRLRPLLVNMRPTSREGARPCPGSGARLRACATRAPSLVTKMRPVVATSRRPTVMKRGGSRPCAQAATRPTSHQTLCLPPPLACVLSPNWSCACGKTREKEGPHLVARLLAPGLQPGLQQVDHPLAVRVQLLAQGARGVAAAAAHAGARRRLPVHGAANVPLRQTVVDATRALASTAGLGDTPAAARPRPQTASPWAC